MQVRLTKNLGAKMIMLLVETTIPKQRVNRTIRSMTIIGASLLTLTIARIPHETKIKQIKIAEKVGARRGVSSLFRTRYMWEAFREVLKAVICKTCFNSSIQLTSL